MTQDTPTSTADPVAKAIAMLDMLTPDVRENVLDRMDPAMRQRIQDRIESTPDGSRPHAGFSSDVTRSQLMRESAARIQERRIVEAERVADHLDPIKTTDGVEVAPAMPADPLEQLSRVHPAAVARAMQGERAEAWAIVIDRLNDNARGALMMYLDRTAQQAISDARARQHELPIQLLATIERAIARTIVPMALREQAHMMPSPPPHTTGARHGAAI